MLTMITRALLLLSFSASLYGLPVQVSSIGQWGDNYRVPEGNLEGWVWDAHVWVDVIVENKSYFKEVGLYWTADNWQSFQIVQGRYDGMLSRKTELWSIDFDVGPMMSCYSCVDGDSKKIEFAVFFKNGDETFWDNNNGANYRLILRDDFEPMIFETDRGLAPARF